MCVFVKPKQRLSVFFLVWFSTSEAIEEEAEQELNIVLLSHWDNIQSGGRNETRRRETLQKTCGRVIIKTLLPFLLLLLVLLLVLRSMVSSPLSLRLLQQQATSSHHWVETPESTSCCQEKTRGSVVILNRCLCPRSHWQCSNKWHQHEHVRNVFTGRTRHLAHYVARRKSVLEPSVAPRVSTFNATSGCRSQEKPSFWETSGHFHPCF